MVTSTESSLNPARGDDRRLTSERFLGALELGARGGVEFIEIGRAEVGQRVALEPGPEVLHWLEVGRGRRQERHLDFSLGGVQVLAHQLAAVRLQAVSDDQADALERPQLGAKAMVSGFVHERSAQGPQLLLIPSSWPPSRGHGSQRVEGAHPSQR